MSKTMTLSTCAENFGTTTWNDRIKGFMRGEREDKTLKFLFNKRHSY